jgi:hypothetical protein
MQKFVALMVFLGLLSFPLLAQDSPKLEVFGGYQYLRLNNFNNGTGGGTGTGPNINANGWDTSVTGYFSKYLGVTGDFSGSYKTFNGNGGGGSFSITGNAYTYAGGPVVALREGKINPFVHVLFGGIHEGVSVAGGCGSSSCSLSGYTMMLGGGVDVKAARAVSIRLLQFDWVYAHFGSPIGGGSAYGESQNARIASGVVFRF